MWGWIIEWIGIKINDKSVCMGIGWDNRNLEDKLDKNKWWKNVGIIDKCCLSGNKIFEMKRKIVWVKGGKNRNLRDHYAKTENFKD